MKQSTASKYQHIRDSLESEIRSGGFAAGEQFPAEQALADRFGVSYLTARRAVCELVEADLLERRARKGTFVRSRQLTTVTTTLSLITSSYDHALMREFIQHGVRLAEKHGWQPNIIRLSSGQQDAAVRAIRNGDLALVLLDEIPAHSALGHEMRSARGKAVCLGSPTFDAGVPTILNDPDEIFKAGVDYLLGHGHRDIYLVHQTSSDGPDMIQHAAWRHATAAIYDGSQADSRCLSVETAMYQCPTQDAYETTMSFLASGNPVSAFYSFGDEITQGVLAAIRDSGRSVPDDISVLNVLDSPSMRFAHPPVTSIDVNFKEQFDIAYEILSAAQDGLLPEEKVRYVRSRVIERKSVCSPASQAAVAARDLAA